MRRLILKVHLVLALIAGAFMAVLGVTGSVIAFEPELDRLLHPNVSYVTPGAKVLSLVEIGEAASRKYGGEPIVAFLPPSSPQFPAEVIMSRGIVAVNQYTGQVLGLRTRGPTVLGFVRALHTRLVAGDIGRSILRWSAVAMLFSLASGLYLWWPIKRVRIRRPWFHARFCFDLHNSIGILSLLPLLLLAATGTVIGFEDQVARLLDKFAHPSLIHASQSPASSVSRPGSAPITPDQAVGIACAQLPGTVPYRVQMPQYGGFYVVALAYADHRIAGDSNSLSIDPLSGSIISTHQSTDLSMRESFMATNEAIHTGSIFGVPSRIIAALAGVLLPVQFVSGFIMWLRRAMPSRPDWAGGARI